jgi:hypothetical protein
MEIHSEVCLHVEFCVIIVKREAYPISYFKMIPEHLFEGTKQNNKPPQDI